MPHLMLYHKNTQNKTLTPVILNLIQDLFNLQYAIPTRKAVIKALASKLRTSIQARKRGAKDFASKFGTSIQARKAGVKNA